MIHAMVAENMLLRSTLAHALDAMKADEPCHGRREYVSTLAHALDATLADDRG